MQSVNALYCKAEEQCGGAELWMVLEVRVMLSLPDPAACCTEEVVCISA